MKKEMADLKKKMAAKPIDDVPVHHIINGENVMMWPAKYENKFALDLMSKLFEKEEIAGHICFKSTGARQSPRPLLCRERVTVHHY